MTPGTGDIERALTAGTSAVGHPHLLQRPVRVRPRVPLAGPYPYRWRRCGAGADGTAGLTYALGAGCRASRAPGLGQGAGARTTRARDRASMQSSRAVPPRHRLPTLDRAWPESHALFGSDCCGVTEFRMFQARQCEDPPMPPPLGVADPSSVGRHAARPAVPGAGNVDSDMNEPPAWADRCRLRAERPGPRVLCRAEWQTDRYRRQDPAADTWRANSVARRRMTVRLARRIVARTTGASRRSASGARAQAYVNDTWLPPVRSGSTV
ncbi:hypothetical protein ACVWZD_005521 [Streptomyces sp. TE3672]